MNHKSQKYQQFSLLALMAFACAICIFVLWFSSVIVSNVENEERDKMEQWAEATKLISQDERDDSEIIDFLFNIIQGNTSIPVIVTDSLNAVISARNVDDVEVALQEMKKDGHMFDINIGQSNIQHIYYAESSVIRRLSLFPAVAIALAALFIIFAYLVFSRAKQREQDKVWIGLARETAHQLGTPITALNGWTDLLASGDVEPQTVATEIQRDTERLKHVADRFSKIGSSPDMVDQNIGQTLESIVSYLRSRMPQSINIQLNLSDNQTPVRHNPVLLGWAIENLCRNAADAMNGRGDIVINQTHDGTKAIIDVTDKGKGMTRATARRIFDAGFTTKQRGWGIGLALARRIICEYHKGKIFVADTAIGEGTTIRIKI